MSKRELDGMGGGYLSDRDPGGPRRRRTALLSATLGVFFVAVVVIIATASRGADMSWVARIPGKDFTGHLALFGTLAFLWHGVACHQAPQSRDLACRPVWHPKAWPPSCAVLALLVLAEELSQIGLSTRTFSFSDLLADVLGLWLGFVASALVWRD